MTVRATVLITVHNGGDAFRACLDSVLGQTVEDFELLVVDDASTDGSAELAESLGDRRVRVVRNVRNLGQVPSLNLALPLCSSPLIARQDADDLWRPTMLERLLEAMESDPDVALAGTWLDSIDEQEHLWSRTRGRVRDFADFATCALLDFFPFAHNSIMYRRDVVVALGGYNPSLAPAEDKDLYRRLVLARREARCIEEPLALYRQHEAQLSRVHADVQRHNDDVAHERFLAELAPEIPPAPMRLLLTGSPRYWRAEAPRLDAASLDRFVAGVATRLRLSGEERKRIAGTLASRAAHSAVGGWSTGAPGYRTHSRQLLPFAARNGGRATRALLMTYPLAVAVSPAGGAVSTARTALRRSARSGPPAAVRRALRRSLRLRALYTRLLGRADL